MLIGTTDKHRKFHPLSLSVCRNETFVEYGYVCRALTKSLSDIYGYHYKPSILIADGADAITNGFQQAFNYSSDNDFTRIMCWAHLYRIVKKDSEKLPQGTQFLKDVEDLQTSHSPELFKRNTELFFKKWYSKNIAKIDEYLVYFNNTWIESRNNNWYEGAAIRVPANDNGLEGKNGSIKGVHTLRERMAVNVYLRNAFDMLRNWSNDTETENKFNETYQCPSETWELAFLYLSNDSKQEQDKALIKKIGKTNKYLLTKNGDRINNNYINCYYDRLHDFDELILYMKTLRVVTLNCTNWTESTCTCKFFLKNYLCYHVIALAVNEGLTVIDNKYIKRAIGRKNQAGRKSKTFLALKHQNN